MNNYTITNIVNELLSLPQKSNKRVVVDPRSYLIGVLVYKFDLTQHAIADMAKINRHKVQHNKGLPVYLWKDKSYQENIKKYYEKFPFDFSKVVPKTKNRNTKIKVIIYLSKLEHKKLKAYAQIKGYQYVPKTIRYLIEKSMKLWEE
jgi:hypothetical protein